MILLMLLSPASRVPLIFPFLFLEARGVSEIKFHLICLLLLLLLVLLLLFIFLFYVYDIGFLQGYVFVDRDGEHFRHILNWLRDGVVPVLKDNDYTELLREAEYYQLIVSHTFS